MAVQIPISELQIGKWYVGRGRNGNVGLWNGVYFLVIAEKNNEYVIKHEPYYSDVSGCFQPFVLVDEGVMVESFGKIGWDKHYGRRMRGHAHSAADDVEQFLGWRVRRDQVG